MLDDLSEDPVGERSSLLDFLANGEDVEVYVESNTSVTRRVMADQAVFG